MGHVMCNKFNMRQANTHTITFSTTIIMKSLSIEQTHHIISQLELGHSTHQIAHSTGLNQSTIGRLCSKHLPNLPKASGGHPSIISPVDMCHAIRLIGSGKAKNAVQVIKTLQDVKNCSISPQTIHHHLKKAGMKAVVKQKCPLLAHHHRRARLDFALSHQDWTIEDWKHVIWSDETKINRIGSDGRKWAWKRAGESLSDRIVEGTVKFGGGSVMIWGCMTWEGVGMACKIDGRMDADLYVQILEDELQRSWWIMDFPQRTLSSSRIMTPSIPAERPGSGWRSMDLRSWCGLLSPQTLIP